MTQQEFCPFQVGERVKVVASLPMAREGEQGRVVALHHDLHGELFSLTVLIDHNPSGTRGITVFPHEIVSVETQDSASEVQW